MIKLESLLNQPLEKTYHDIKKIEVIAKQLRVPEISYRMSSTEELSAEITLFFQGMAYVSSDEHNESSLKALTKSLGKTTLPVALNNYAFISDRVYDVWGRKNKLNNEINDILTSWRLPFFKVMYQSQSGVLLESFISFVDQLSNDLLGWEPKPERSKRIILDELTRISVMLFQLDCQNEEAINVLIEDWKDFIRKQSTKALKVLQRLTLLESRKSWEEYCENYAKKYLNTLFSGQMVSQSIQLFIAECWVKVLSQSIKKQTSPTIADDMKTLTAKVKAVFCTKGNAALKWVDNLSEDIQTQCDRLNLVVREVVWEGVQSDLVNILQAKDLDEMGFIAFDFSDDWSKPAEVTLDSQILQGHWYYSIKDSVESREQVVSIFPETQEVLCCNYLGIKTKRYRYADLNLALTAHTLKPLVADSMLIEVVQKTSIGLLKVAETQKKARMVAAEKAQKEAEDLLAQKQHAEKIAKLKAEQIAEQAKEIKQKHIDKQRAEQEQNAQLKVSKCKLGAWVTIAQYTVENTPQRFKLVVKFAASNKYIFVDKLGVKKVEYTEADLVAGVLSEDIKILSDGQEFEESLERVVSRLRTPKE